ncbi:hypothetical protein [Chryseolinea lacunae]|uniref:Uncharacterized protein n=1 Tax=Chryseolinea lacunae TaxID=2801331 RepID=A0ABS1KZW3_9BACT|nr:hypothetical protein [Chryseolinea lacunae]MBL0744969.1 hypothetical protein [Chryseolinea lacunae]
MITIRIVAIILILTIVNSASAQGEHKSPEVMKDAIGMFEFQESSIELSEKGKLELDRFAKWYLSNSNQLLYRVYLGGVVSTEEVNTDHFGR